MKQSSLGSFFMIKRSATASNDILPPSKKIKGDIKPSPSPSFSSSPSPSPSVSTTSSKKPEKEKEINNKKLDQLKEEEEEEQVFTPPIPSSPPQNTNSVTFNDDSGEDTEEDEEAQEHGIFIYNITKNKPMFSLLYFLRKTIQFS